MKAVVSRLLIVSLMLIAMPFSLKSGIRPDLSPESGAVVQPRRVILRMPDVDIEAVSAAADQFISASLPFVFERVVRPDDSPRMKELLARMQWKNCQLVESLTVPESVEVVDICPGMEAELIRMAVDSAWDVRVPKDWGRIIREETRTDSFKTYYVSNEGDDSADGLSPESAWKTLDKVNNAALGFGDKVLFRSGDIFRGGLEPMSGREGAPIMYGRYGRGVKPVIEPSYDASSEGDWEKVGDRLWRCEKPSEFELANVIFNHGRKGCAWKEDRLDQLEGRDLHFTWVKEEKAIYMVSDSNPASRFRSIEIAEKRHIINEGGCHDVCYEGLWLRYGGAHGIGGSEVRRISIKDCDICWIGGSTLYIDNDGRGVRYGNGIELWSLAQDVLVEGCRVWECWDAGLTNQSNENGVCQKNIIYRSNKIWNCEYSFEYWQQGDNASTVNVVFEDNVCLNAGKGWGHTRRWNPNAGHLMFYDTTAETEGFVVRNNIFRNTEDCGIRLFNAWYPSILMEGNRWVIRRNLLCRYHGRPTSDLINKYPDHLDATHDDNEAEIQGQTAEDPMVFGAGRKELRRFRERFGFDR
ncbi:MAG: right-handed parallel beta-helix repeat-containing protein [Bacteroidales bacterium]|nr:right-handed parallel beta-helix repeat-containing protein [Candidatus Cryptobacteroides onthequi]